MLISTSSLIFVERRGAAGLAPGKLTENIHEQNS